MVDFELLKGSIKKYRRSSLVYHILEMLKNSQKGDNRNFPFWKLLVLLKWSYLHTTDFIARRKIQAHELDTLLRLLDDFEAGHLTEQLTVKKDILKFLKIVAFQQFPYQESFHNSVIDRQIVLYLETDSSYDMSLEFKNRTGLDLKSFFSYCHLLYIYLNASNFNRAFKFDGILHEDFFKLFEEAFSKSELDAFLKLISIKSANDFEMLHKLGDEKLQLYETNFYITKPILFFWNNYHLIHKAVLVQSIKHFVYTFLKQNSETFSTEFGKRLEKYIGLGLKEIRIDFKNEKELKREYSLTKISDYFVEEDILIECKAIELHPRSGVLREVDIISKELATSITKAYCQLLSTANAIDKTKTWYGIVITYKEMYLGFGKDAWEEFLQKPVGLFVVENNIQISILPPENLFFINIEDWDHIIQCIKDKNTTLKDILIKGRELNTSLDPAKKIFLIGQVLEKYFKIGKLNLSYLTDAHKVIDSVYDNFKKD